MIFENDASEDNTGNLIKKELELRNIDKDRYFIQNWAERGGSLHGINHAMVNHCKNYEITLLIDGDDELLGTQAFKLLNAVYQKTKKAMVYTNHIYFSALLGIMDKGYSRPYTELNHQLRNYRK